MNYVEKDYEEIFEEALQDSLESGLISHAEDFEDFIKNKQDISNYYVMDKSVISQMIAKIYTDGITPAYESAKVEYAEGVDLDDIGKIVGVPRPQATYSYANVVFSLTEVLEEDVNIEPGVIVSTDSGIEYNTLENIFIAAGEESTEVSCAAVEPGVSSKVIENTLVNIETELEVDLTCNNNKASTVFKYRCKICRITLRLFQIVTEDIYCL